MRKIVIAILSVIMVMNLVTCCIGVTANAQSMTPNTEITKEIEQYEDSENKEMTKDYGFETLVVNIITLFFAFVGGCFALYQWNKNTVYKRAEVVKSLIESVRGNPDISTIMDIIDWNEDFTYDGKFSVQEGTERKVLIGLSDDDLFKMVDQTLSMFSYICYLERVRTITKKDMRFFEYELRRLVDNPHIRNYLYSLYHWSKSLGVKTSFLYVIEYGLKKGYLDKSFKRYDLNHALYKCFLVVEEQTV